MDGEHGDGERPRFSIQGVGKPAAPPVTAGEGQPRAEPQPVDLEAWVSLGLGAVIALVVLLVPFLSHIFGTLSVLIHEIGHAATAWILGHAALPQFDLQYGGGWTRHSLDKSWFLLAVIYFAFAGGIYRFLNRRLGQLVLPAALVVHSVLTYSPALTDLLIIVGGHAGELVFAGVFFYRALSGVSVINPNERPLYASIALFMVFKHLKFCFDLVTDDAARYFYENVAKGGGHIMDLSRLADGLGVGLTAVALLFLLAGLVPLAAAVADHRYRQHLVVFFHKVLLARGRPVPAWIPDPEGER
jgi:hypothetical protein